MNLSLHTTAILIIIDVRYQLSTVFSTSFLLGNRCNHDNGRQFCREWQYFDDIINIHVNGYAHILLEIQVHEYMIAFAHTDGKEGLVCGDRSKKCPFYQSYILRMQVYMSLYTLHVVVKAGESMESLKVLTFNKQIHRDHDSVTQNMCMFRLRGMQNVCGCPVYMIYLWLFWGVYYIHTCT